VCFLGIALFSLQIGCTLVKALATWAIGRFGAREKVHIADQLLRNYLSRPYEWFLGKNTGELHRNVVHESNVVVDWFVVNIFEIYLGFVLTSITCLVLLLIDPWVAMVSATLIGAMFAMIYARVRSSLNTIGESIMP
jgi:ABC-type bacteriocin/lantibiotic exporter with double-glycine peptidase domain